MNPRHALVGIAALALATAVLAQVPPPAAPAIDPPAAAPAKPGAPPLPPPLPPQPEYGTDPELEPQVTIIRRDTETLEEVRVNGELRYVKVTPRIGPPYFLVPSPNGQNFLRYNSLETGLKPPMWLLFSW